MRRFAYWAIVLPALLLMTSVPALATKSDQETRLRTETRAVPYEVKYVFDRDMRAGTVKKVRPGTEGKVVRTYAEVSLSDRAVERRVIKEEVKDASPAVFLMGKPNSRAVSRGTYTRAKVLQMESTAYIPSAGFKKPTYRTRTGTRAEYGVIAVDPKVIPLGTLMYIEGYGFGIAEDTGGRIKGNIIDVCLPTRAEALKWGRRTVTVHVFKKSVEVSKGS